MAYKIYAESEEHSKKLREQEAAMGAEQRLRERLKMVDGATSLRRAAPGSDDCSFDPNNWYPEYEPVEPCGVDKFMERELGWQDV